MEFLDSNSPEDRLSERSLKLKSLSVSVSFSLSLLHFQVLGQNRKIGNLLLVDLRVLS